MLKTKNFGRKSLNEIKEREAEARPQGRAESRSVRARRREAEEASQEEGRVNLPKTPAARRAFSFALRTSHAPA
jgi:hypothetical protein